MRYLNIALLAVALALAGCDDKATGQPKQTGTTVTPGTTVPPVSTSTTPAGDPMPTGVVATDLKSPVPVAAADQPIKADGKLDEAGWKNATAFTGFVAGKGAAAAPVQSRVLVTYDKDNLYVAVINDEPETAKIVAKASKRDDRLIWGGDDHVEVYIDPAAAKAGEYVAFFVTTNNTVYDRKKVEAWDGQWTSGTAVIDGKYWVAELAIPWKTLDVKEAKAGNKLGLLVARARSAGKRGDFYMIDCDEEAKDTSCYPTLILK